MLGLIIGGSGSGKSAIAETLIVSYGASRRYYIATMSASDAESKRRVARHRRMRDGKGFETVECPTNLSEAVPDSGDVLLECLSNLVANEMFLAGESPANTVRRVMDGVDALRRSCDHVIIVTNNVFEDGISYPGETEDYIACLGELNRRLAEAADLVIEAQAGIPAVLKGELPSCLQHEAHTKEDNSGMILIIGGAYQGKLAWACRRWELDPDGPEIWNGADGMPSEAEWPRIRAVNGLHQLIRTILDDEQALALLKEKLRMVSDSDSNSDTVPGRIILTDELGCGLVPISAEERKWRETTGRFCEALAKEADEVYRVSCGLAQKLR